MNKSLPIAPYWRTGRDFYVRIQKDFAAAGHFGGINWGIYGIWGFNAVGWLLGGSLSWLSRTVFILVGLASLCLIPSLCMGDSCNGKEA